LRGPIVNLKCNKEDWISGRKGALAGKMGRALKGRSDLKIGIKDFSSLP